MRTLTGKRVLITGGASGIGKALATRLAKEQAHLLLVDLNPQALESAAAELGRAGAKVDTYTLDVTNHAGITALRSTINASVGPIDVLVNNAGVVFGGPFLEVPLERHLLTYQINVLGLVVMTYTFLPDLIARPDAHIVNVASASGFIGLPHGSTYASSKWAVIGFSESLMLELDLLGHKHVHVTTACPSYVATGLFEGARAPFATSILTPERLADKITRAITANKLWIRTPWLVKVTPMLKGLLPTRAFYVVAGLLGANTSMTQWKGRGA